MRKLGTHAIAGAVLVTLAVGAPAAFAQAPDPVPAGTSTTVKADCFGGPGSISLRQTRQESGSTRVDIAGHDVRNGTWKGAFNPSPGSEPSEEIDVRATANGREFRESFEVDDASRTTELMMVSGRKHVCGFFLADRPHATLVATPDLTLVARYPEPGELTTRIFVVGCKNGTTWRYSTEVTFVEDGVGWGATGFVCRDHVVRIPKSPLSSDSGARPSAIEVVVRSSIGQVRHLSYRTSTPDSTEGRS